MDKDLDIKHYLTWSLSEKLYFFDCQQYILIDSWEEKQLVSFLKFFILNQNENKYIIQKALSLFVDFSLLGKISDRQTLNLLVDETNDIEGTFIQLERLKSLFLFYESEANSIIQIFEKNTNNDDIEIKSECLYSLGIIHFWSANKEINENEFREKIEISIAYFRASCQCTENRIDSLFFQLIAEVVQHAKFTPSFQNESYLRRITQVLWEYRLFSFDDKTIYLKVKIYRIIHNLLRINKQNPSEWLQYKDAFRNLCLAFYELKNAEIKEKLFQSALLETLKDGLIATNLEPYFRINFNALKIKIEQYSSLTSTSNEEKDVLNYILSLIEDRDTILNERISLTKKKLKTAYPHVSDNKLNDILNVDSVESLQSATLIAFETFGSFSFDNLYDKLLASIIKLQGDISYRSKSEDERNTYIGALLSIAGFQVKDQTFWGSSNTGKSAGEVDIMVLDNNQLPFSIIEALILDSLKQDYLKQHIDKIYKYDTTGLQNNVILIYSEAKNFSDFCTRYFALISTYDYPYKQLSSENIDSGYSEMKIYKTTIERNDKPTNLYHIVVNLYN